MRKIFSPSIIIILLFAFIIPFLIVEDSKYNKKEGVIAWDVKSYYAYLPSALIYEDLSLDFMNQDLKFFKYWIWPITTPTNKKAIVTTMGLSVLYSPFFLVAHGYAKIHPKYEPNGFSKPYHVALAFSTYFYFILGLILLRKILKKYFDDWIIALTLFAVGFGTNLFYYVVYEAPMTHGYNFVLFILFLYFFERWNKEYSLKNTIILGAVSGLITLIRPTNITILLLIPFYGVFSFNSLKDRFLLLIMKWPKITLMAVAFVAVWIPQFIYWKYVSGQFFYFSYDELGGQFFFNNPQIFNILFSIKKSWYVYTPIMFIATVGLYPLFKQKNKYALPITIFLIVNVYVLSCWWAWWNGGGFGIRSMVDFYGLMAFAFAAFLKWSFNKKIIKFAIIGITSILIFYNLFQIQQYRNYAIHYWWMTKEAYCETFLKLKPTCKYWKLIMYPDYGKAAQGIYEYRPWDDKTVEVTNIDLRERIIEVVKNDSNIIDSLIYCDTKLPIDTLIANYAIELIYNRKAKNYYVDLKIEKYCSEIMKCRSWKEELEKKAKRKGISFDENLILEAKRMYETYSIKY